MLGSLASSWRIASTIVTVFPVPGLYLIQLVYHDSEEKYDINIRAEYHKRHAARLLIHDSSDSFHLLCIFAEGSIGRCNLGDFVRRDSRNTSDVLGTREEQPRRVKFVRQCLVHPPESQAIEHEAHVELRALIHAETVAKLEADMLCMHLVNTPFVPRTAVDGGICLCTADKNEVPDKNRRSVFSEALDDQAIQVC